MTRQAIVFESVREGYAIDQVRHPITAGELREILEDYDDDDIVIVSHDNDYTFGSISRDYRQYQLDDDNRVIGHVDYDNDERMSI